MGTCWPLWNVAVLLCHCSMEASMGTCWWCLNTHSVLGWFLLSLSVGITATGTWMILCLYREMFLIVVTAALKLEPGTTFLVNANVPKHVTSAALNTKNNDFLLMASAQIFFSVVRFPNQWREGEAGFCCPPSCRAGGTAPGYTAHGPSLSPGGRGGGMLKQCSNHLAFCMRLNALGKQSKTFCSFWKIIIIFSFFLSIGKKKKKHFGSDISSLIYFHFSGLSQ